MKRLKYGRLYWLPLEAKDIGRDFLWRVFNKLGFKYIPFTLRFYDELYLREDVSKYSRRLIYECRKWGVITYVVQEGPIRISGHAEFCHLPLYADIFLCPQEDYEFWVREGMPKQSIKVYDMQKFNKEDYNGVVFLRPFVTWNDLGSNWRKDYYNNVEAIKVIYDMLDKDVVFKPHQSHPELITPLLPPHRIVWEKEEDLIKKYEKIYCFSDSPIRKDCEMLGKDYEIVDKQNLELEEGMPKEKIKAPDTQKRKEDYNGVVFLIPITPWDIVPFTWRKDYRDVKAIKGIYDMLDKDVVFKPHQAHPELITPLLPPHRIVWDKAEDLIKRYDKIYCFSTCSIRKDCEMLGKDYEIIDK